MAAGVSQDQLRIADVVDETGVSKELIHHYLRQGLLPPTSSRARYGSIHVRLLRLIRKLREDHNLPLEMIRQVFEVFNFDPDRLAALGRVESLCERMARFAAGQELPRPRSLSVDVVAQAADITPERVAEYVHAKVITPLQQHDPATASDAAFCVHDANTVALCEQGMRMGIPFDSFRTVASHIRLAFELEHAEFFRLDEIRQAADPRGAIADLFARREIALNLIQSIVQSLVARRLAAIDRPPILVCGSLDDLVYRPSHSFLRRHGLVERIEQLRSELARTDDAMSPWLQLVQLLLHAGRYREAVFFGEQALRRWPAEPLLAAHHGLALLLAGERRRGQEQLARVAPTERVSWCPAAAALVRWAEAGAAEADEASPGDVGAIRDLVDLALPGQQEGAPNSSPGSLFSRLFGGYLLAALPPVYRDERSGLGLLLAVYRETSEARVGRSGWLAGLVERLRINAAYLLFDRCHRLRATPEGSSLLDQLGAPSLDALRSEICCLDPQSRFAERVFVNQAPRRQAQE